MSALQKINYFSEQAYFDFELTSPVRHEYVDGQIYAMAGAGDRHNRISGNIFSIYERRRGAGSVGFS